MRTFFDYDNIVFSGINKVVNLIGISIVWIVSCLPVVTIGAATSALYYVVQKIIRKEEGYVFQNYLKSFQENFKQSTLVWIILLIMELALAVDVYVMKYYLQIGNNSWGYAYIVFLLLMIVFAVWGIYLFSYIARFVDSTKRAIKNTAILAILNIGKTFLILLIIGISILIVFVLPILICIIPAVSMWAINGVIESIYQQYIQKNAKHIRIG